MTPRELKQLIQDTVRETLKELQSSKKYKNITDMARELDVSRTTIYSMIHRHEVGQDAQGNYFLNK